MLGLFFPKNQIQADAGQSRIASFTLATPGEFFILSSTLHDIMRKLDASFWIGTAGILGALGVALGAMGAHLPSSIIPLLTRETYELAVRYHLYHVLALLACGILLAVFPERGRLLRWSAALFAGGIVLFSGSLYALVLTDVLILGAITPIGGVFWIAAWGLLGWAFLARRG